MSVERRLLPARPVIGPTLSAMADDRIHSVWVDPDVCIYHHLCIDECPEVLTVDPETDQAVVRADAAQWFASKATEIRQAANVCPVDAIRINEPRPPRPSQPAAMADNPPMQRTGAAGIVSVIRRWFRRGFGR